MKLFLLLLFFTKSLLAENVHLLSTEIIRYDYTATAIGLEDARISYTLPGISYTMMSKNYIVLASLRYSKKQSLGSTAFGSTRIGLEQMGWKYELGVGYKYYLSEKLFIGPALLFSDTYTKVYQTTSFSSTLTKKHDIDFRLYAIVGYRATSSTLLFGTLELDNDLLSNEHFRDYSQYNLALTINQFLSKNLYLFIKYEQALRDKEATTGSTGNRDYRGYGFGIGMKI